MKPVVRLAGADDDVRAVARAAVEALRTDAAAEKLFPALWRLHGGRKRFIAAADRPIAVREPPTPSAARWWRAVWGVLLGLGLLGALVTAVMLAPADRKNAFLDPELAVTISLPAGLIALAALLIVLVLPVPDGPSARTGEVVSVLVGTLVVGILIFRLVVGVDDERGFVADDLMIWRPMTGVIALLLAGVAVRCDLIRRRHPTDPGAAAAHRSRAEMSRSLRADAARLAASRAATTEWQRRLDALDRHEIDAETLAQARTMAPSAWLAWLAYDGEIDIAGVVPRA